MQTTTRLLDGKLDVKQRLDELQKWQIAWDGEDGELAQRLAVLNLDNRMEMQRGAQITRWRRRLRLNLVREPLEIAPEIVQELGYTALRQSLVQQFARLSKEERLLWLQNFLFIMTPDLRRLNNKLSQVRSYRSLGQQRNFLLGGASGMGKSTYLDWFTVRHLPCVEPERNHVPVIKIDAPVNNRSPKPLFQRMILECGLFYTWSTTEEDLLMRLAIFFQRCGTELLIVDEVEHITRPQIRRRLLEISNLTPGLPIICASCNPFLWAQGDVEVAGRWNDYFELRPYTGERLRQLLAFLELLLPFSQPSHLALDKLPSNDHKSAKGVEGPARFIERWTGGILRDIMILVMDASRRAIERDLPNLSLSLLEATWREIQCQPVADFLPTWRQEVSR